MMCKNPLNIFKPNISVIELGIFCTTTWVEPNIVNVNIINAYCVIKLIGMSIKSPLPFFSGGNMAIFCKKYDQVETKRKVSWWWNRIENC